MSFENTTHKLNLTGGEISTILNYLNEICEGPKVDRNNAIDTAKARNPHAKVIGVNPLVGRS